MDVLLFHRTEYERLYNCSAYSIDKIPLEQRQHPVLGYSILALFAVYEILYLPFLFAIKKRTSQSCYKFMFYIGVADVIVMWVNGAATGYFALEGAVFCSHPVFIYICGVLANVFWVAETFTAITFAFSRCVELCSETWGKRLFLGWRTWLWMVPPSAYAFYFGWFTKPVAFSGMYFTWFFNPHLGYLEDKEDSYYNGCQRFNNTFIFFALIALYAVFSVLYAIKNYKYSKMMSTRSGKSQKMIFIQVLAMSAVNAAASGIYLYEQFAEIGKFVIVLGQFAWISAHGLPAVIYLFMNKTLRRDVQEMLNNPWGRSNTVSNNSSVRGKSTVMLI